MFSGYGGGGRHILAGDISAEELAMCCYRVTGTAGEAQAKAAQDALVAEATAQRAEVIQRPEGLRDMADGTTRWVLDAAKQGKGSHGW
jgi:hypothetical protein